MKILLVCLGNICRSPLAKGILREKAGQQGLNIEVDSAGFEKFHEDEGADPRSVQVAAKHGIDLRGHVARLFRTEDFDRYDRIYAMDEDNYEAIIELARDEADMKKVDLIMNLVRPGLNLPVPDPYYGGKDGFEKVYTLLDKASENLVEKISSGELSADNKS